MPTRYNWLADTSTDAFEVFVRLQRDLSPAQKLSQLLDMVEIGMRAHEQRVRKNYPNADEREVFLRTAALRLGRETAWSVSQTTLMW